MALGKPIDPKIVKAIEDDMAELDGTQSIVQLATDEASSKFCNCTGGPGKEKDDELGTGLLDDYTICPKCNGSGKV